MRRHGLMLAGLLFAVAVAAMIAHYLAKPTTLRVAAGPFGSDEVRLIAALVPVVQREKGSVRLKLTLADDGRAAAALLDEGKADLAVTRSDVALPRDGLTTLILKRSHAILVAYGDKGISKAADLRGRKIGVSAQAPEDQRLLELILAHYEALDGPAQIAPIPPDERIAALAEGRIDALFLLGSALDRRASDLIAALARGAGEKGLAFIPIREAAAIAARNPAVEASELVMGAFGGAPPRPPESHPSVSVTHRLMADRDLADDKVGELVRILLNARQQILADLPAAQGIEAPQTDKNAALPPHSGAAAFLDGEQETFFEKYGDWFYLGVMAVSLLGSGAAAMVGRMNSRRRHEAMAGLSRLIAIAGDARAAPDLRALQAIEAESDAILSAALRHTADGEIDEAGISAYRLAAEQAARAMAERRHALERVVDALPG